MDCCSQAIGDKLAEHNGDNRFSRSAYGRAAQKAADHEPSTRRRVLLVALHRARRFLPCCYAYGLTTRSGINQIW
jgi:hypothetical protein